MRYMRCKCGELTCWTTMGSPQCVGCPKCNTTLAESPEGHDTPAEHDWREEWTIDKATGERGKERVCLRCYKREAVTLESESAGRTQETDNDG